MRHILRQLSLTVAAIGLCTACAMGSYPQSTYTPQMSQTEMACLTFASQSASGAGQWSSDRAMRAAIYDNVKAQYYQQCMANKAASR
jgi:hypothetical protein